jgi:hypothetical protein
MRLPEEAPAAHPATKVMETVAPDVPTVDEANVSADRERRRIRNVFIGVGAAVVLLGFLLLHSCAGSSAPSTPTRSPSPRSTPSTSAATVTVRASDYLGRPVAQARSALVAAGLNVRVTSVVSTAGAGSVVGVSPTGTVRRGSTVTLTVATAPTKAPPKPRHGKHGKG